MSCFDSLMRSRLERRPDWQIALWVTVLMRVVYSGVAAIGSQVLHPDLQRVHTNFTGELTNFTGIGYALVGVWQRFDTLLYLHIAAHGYDHPTLTVFYPLYPALIRVLTPVFGSMIAALFISTLSTFFLFWGFCKLAAFELPKPLVVRALLLYAVWPASFIFFAGYAEALTIALIVWSVYFARNGQWWASAACGFFASLARAAGGLVFVALALFAWRRRKEGSWPVLLVPVGAVAYPLWLYCSGHVSVTESYQHYWQIQIAPPWFTLGQVVEMLVTRPNAIFLLNVLILVAVSLLSVAVRPRLEYALYSAAVIVQVLMRFEHPLLLGCPRYLLLIFPAFVALGSLAAMWPRFGRMVWPLCGLLLVCNLGWMWAFLNWSLEL